MTFSVAIAENKVISIRTDLWCPYACSPQSSSPGFMIEISKFILEKNGYTVDYQTLNWARSITETREGKFSAIIGAAKSDAPDFIFPDYSLGQATFRLFGKKNSTWKFTDETSVKNKKIGVINGYTYDELTTQFINKKNPSFLVISGDSPLEQLIKMLENGRIDALYEDPLVFQETLNKMKRKSSEFKDLGAIQAYEQPLFIAFSPKYKDADKVKKLFDQEIVQMRKSGELKKILTKYSVKDWKI